MKLSEKVRIARELAAEALEKFSFLDVIENSQLPKLSVVEQNEIHSIINTAIVAELKGN